MRHLQIYSFLFLGAAVLLSGCSSSKTDPEDTNNPDLSGSSVTECEDECTEMGEKVCQENTRVICGNFDTDVCLEYGNEVSCGNATCVDGNCTVSCADECQLENERQCDENAVQLCGDYNGDSCLEWSPGTDCLSGTVCVNGFCSLNCEQECTVLGARRCSPDAVSPGIQTCMDSNFDGCLEWGDPTNCSPGQVCSNGVCAVSCSDECTVDGAQRCDNATTIAQCSDNNFDGCLEWTATTTCADGETCSLGHCAIECQNECSVHGATRCSANSIQTCADANLDGCLEWGSAVPCGDEQSCSNGFCAQGCTDECGVLNSTICEGNGIKTCGDYDSDNCLEWGTVAACESGQTCSNGYCAVECTEECTVVGSSRCLENSVQLCGEVDSDACLEWGTPVGCQLGEVCSNGHCALDCTDECTVLGARTCDGDTVKECEDANSDGCLEWSSPASCGQGQTCSNGSCSSECSNECSVSNSTICQGNGVRTCGNTDSDTCLEWGTVVACEADQTCSNGYCSLQCTDECTVVGSSQCLVNSVQLCDDSDDDDCLEWGTPVSCGSSEVCSNGHCSLNCTDECATVGEKQCNVGGDGYQTCGDTTNNGCLEWGSSVSCGNGMICSAGNCATTCTNECSVADSTQCSSSGNAIQTCGDYNDNGCLQWGTPMSCGQTEVCSSGACADASGNNNPVAQLTCPTQADANDLLYFDGTASTDSDGTIVSYRFNFGDGTVVTGPQAIANHSFAGLGTQTVTLTVTDDLGGTGQASCNIQIGSSANPSVTWIYPQTTAQVTQGGSIDIMVDVTAAPGTSINAVELFVDGIGAGIVDQSPPYILPFTVPANAVTSSTIQLIARAVDNDGNIGSSTPLDIFVFNDMPVAAFSALITGNLEISVDAAIASDLESSSESLEVCWAWDVTEAWSASDACDTAWTTTKTDSHTYGVDGEYHIGLKVRDSVSQISSTTRMMNFSSVIDASGTVESTMWYGTVNITGDVTVPSGHTLTIAPGTNIVIVELDQDTNGIGDYDITIDGTLLVEGTETAPVTFTALDTDGVADHNAWGKIDLTSNSTGNIIDWAVFEYGNIGLEVSADTTIRDSIFRKNEIGLNAVGSSANLILERLTIKENEGVGFNISGSTVSLALSDISSNTGHGIHAHNSSQLTITECDISNNGERGIFWDTGDGHSISNSTIQSNGTDGGFIQNALVDWENCEVTNNGNVGIWYNQAGRGNLFHSEIYSNHSDGIRLTSDGSSNPSPVIWWNNIFGNGKTKNLTQAGWSDSVQSSGSNSYDVSTSVFNTPNGEKIIGALVDYNELTGNHSYLTGYLQDGSGNNLRTYTSTSSSKWYSIPGSGVSSLRGFVEDNYTSLYASLAISEVLYEGPANNIQLTANFSSGTVDARFNYWGAWPNVLEIIQLSDHNRLNIEGFVGTPWDANYSQPLYQGGSTLSEDTTWHSDVYITGNLALASGVTLTIDPDVTVTFIPIDQDGDLHGDYRIDRSSGNISAVGQSGSEIRFVALDWAPTEGGFDGIIGNGSGTTQLGHVILDGAYCALQATGGSVSFYSIIAQNSGNCGLSLSGNTVVDGQDSQIRQNGGDGIIHSGSGNLALDNVDITQNQGSGIIRSSSGDLTLQYLEITENGDSGVSYSSSGALSFEAVNISHNANWGVALIGATHAENAITNSLEIQYNTTGGVLVKNSRLGLTQSNLKFNGIGVMLEGSATGTIGACNITYNTQEGLLAAEEGSNYPQTTVNGNNIFGNATTEASWIVESNLDVQSSGGNSSDVSTSVFNTPNGEKIIGALVDYNELTGNHSYLTGYLQDGSGNNLRTYTSTSSSKWYSIPGSGVSSLRGFVEDNYTSLYAKITIAKVVYQAAVTETHAPEMTVLMNSGQLDATGNYWGIFPDVPSKVQEADIGAVDYSNFTSTALTTTGPQ